MPAPPTEPRQAASLAVHGNQEVTTDSILTKLSPEARDLLEHQDKIMADVRAFAKDHPTEMGKVLRVWLSKGMG